METRGNGTPTVPKNHQPFIGTDFVKVLPRNGTNPASKNLESFIRRICSMECARFGTSTDKKGSPLNSLTEKWKEIPKDGFPVANNNSITISATTWNMASASNGTKQGKRFLNYNSRTAIPYKTF